METPSERLKRKNMVENLWILVMRMLLKEKMIGYKIRNEIKKRYGFWCGNVTAYKVLYMLEKGKYVKSEKIGGKVFYSATTNGKKELNEGEKFLKRFLSDK